MDGPLPSTVKKEGDFVKFVPFSEYKNDYDCFEITLQIPTKLIIVPLDLGSTVVLRDHHSSVVQIVAFVLKLLDRYRILRTRNPSLFGKSRVKR